MRIKDVDVPAVLDALQKRYPSGRAVCKITALRKENPDLSEQLQAIDANAGVLWGESLKDRLLRLGVFDDEGSAVKPAPADVPAPVIAPVPIPGANVPAAEAAAPVPPAAHGIQLLYELFSNDPVLTAEVTLLCKRITALTGKLDEAYPDLDISGFRQAHKKWGEAAGEISKRLRFSSGDDFIRAMGYTIHTSKGGRPTNNVDEVLDEIRRRYPNGVASLTVLREENPDLSGKIKTLVNNSGKLWGMPLTDYLTSIGILQDNNEEAQRHQAEIQRQKEEARRQKEEEDARQLHGKALALLDELRSLCGTVPVLMDSNHLQQQHVLLDWRSLKKYRRTATAYDSMDDFLQAEGIIRMLTPQEALDHLTAELKKRLNNKPFTGGIRALKSRHADLPYSLVAPALTDKGVSLQDYLIHQGILPDAETERRMRVTPDEAMFMSYFSNEVNVVVPKNIKFLKKCHFAGCTRLESVDTWRTYFWRKGTKAVIRQFESPGRYVTPELAEVRYDGLTVPIGYAKNALNLQGFEGSRTADINGSFIHVALHATWGEEDMEISDISIDHAPPPYGQMTDHQKRLWNRDILRLDSVLHPEKRLEVIVARGDVGEIKLCVETHLITGDNITDMVGLVIQHKHTEATAYLMQLKQDWIGEVQDPFSQFTLDF